MLRTRSGLPRHCGWNVDRHGKRRVRFRKAGFSTYLTGVPWSEDFMRQYATALEGVKAQANNIGAARTIAGSFDALCVSYYRSPEFRGLKDSTQTARRNIIERFRKEYGTKPTSPLGRAHIKDIIGAKANTPEAANNLLKVLRVVLNHAVEIGMIASNPAIGVKRYRSHGDGIHTWSEAEVSQFEAAHPIGTKARLALELLLGTGQRRCAHGLAACERRRDRGPPTKDRRAAADPDGSEPRASVGGGPEDEPDFPSDRARRAVHGGRFRKLVSRPLQ